MWLKLCRPNITISAYYTWFHYMYIIVYLAKYITLYNLIKVK